MKNQAFKFICSRKKEQVEVVIEIQKEKKRGNSEELSSYHVMEIRVRKIFNDNDGISQDLLHYYYVLRTKYCKYIILKTKCIISCTQNNPDTGTIFIPIS